MSSTARRGPATGSRRSISATAPATSHAGSRRGSPPLPYDYGDAAAADFDGDGSMDLALAVHLSGLVVLIGDKAGGFRGWRDGLELAAPVVGSRARPFSSRAIDVADWNGDGRPDLIALGEGPGRGDLGVSGNRAGASYGLRVYLNPGPPANRWQPVPGPDLEKLHFGDALAVADLDADGYLDLAAASRSYSRGNIVYFGDEAGGWTPAAVPALPRPAYVLAVAADGHEDTENPRLAVASTRLEAGEWISRIDLLTWQSRSRFSLHRVEELPDRSGFASLAWGDLNGDGTSDLVALRTSGDVWVFVGDRTGGVTRLDAPALESAGAGCDGYHVRLADLDNDGRDEVIASFAGEPASPNRDTNESPDSGGCLSGGSLRAWRSR